MGYAYKDATGATRYMKATGSGTVPDPDVPVHSIESITAGASVDIGAVNETAPASDTASSGLNGRLQRIAQRLTSLIALLPSALVGGRLDVNLGGVTGLTSVPVSPLPRAGATGNVHQPSSNTAAVVTKSAAGSGVANVVGGVYWSYDADPTGGSLKIEDGSGNVILIVSITSKGPGFLPFTPPLKGTANTALIATLAAGGSGVTGKVSLNAWTE